MKRSRARALGQHFLKNPRILNKIVRTIRPQASDLIIEIGPGKGALTLPLVAKAGHVIAIEKDRTLAASLQKKDFPNLTVLEADILKVDFIKLLEKEAWEAVKLVGNLPYSISSPLLFRIIGEKGLFSECIFLFQKEFAERICAQPGTKKYAPLSILFQIHFSTKFHFLVPPDSFSPPPRVESALISLRKREKPLFQLEDEAFLRFLKKAFQHRRKTLYNNLIRIQYPPSLLREAFQKFGIVNSIRPEQLTISQLVNLYQFLGEKSKKVKNP
ncbi:MAG: ribosomal RNA small subunit methyltransferase A [Candidatus Aminicenantes bacterium]|nr:ribosomal RNA small subunit methyltransferase A [Candidatus Aminicenantes bacterium]